MPRRNDDDESADALAVVNAAVNGFARLPAVGQLAVVAVVVVGAFLLAAWWWDQQQQQRSPIGATVGGSPQMWLGNPSGATADASNRDNYLMLKPYFAVAYNADRGGPNWVSWRLSGADLGRTPRHDDFHPDDALPADFVRITPHDYNGGGFDRGHQCPYGDRQSSPESGDATFVMTNMLPQAPNVNRKAWEHVESYCRDLARGGHRLYVTAGGAGRGGVGSRGPRDALADGRVTVPAECWKVAVILDDDPGVDPDPATLPASTRVLTVDMPNDQSVVGEEWEQYRTTPAEVERRTGLRFFDRLRPDVAEALRNRVDRMPAPAPRPGGHGRD